MPVDGIIHESRQGPNPPPDHEHQRAPKILTPYRNWKIRSKLLVPLVGVGMASSLLVLAVALLVFRDLRTHTLLELESANELRSDVIKLVGDYRQYLILPIPQVLQELEQSKTRVNQSLIHLKEALTRKSKIRLESEHPQAHEGGAFGRIEASLRVLVSSGDATVDYRDAIAEATENLEDFEEELVDIANQLQFEEVDRLLALRSGNPSGSARDAMDQFSALGRLQSATHAFISETRDYVIQPTDDARSDLAEFQEELTSLLSEIESNPGAHRVVVVQEMKSLLTRLTEQSSETVQRRDSQAVARQNLDQAAEEFKADLRLLTLSVADVANDAVRNGLFLVLAVVVTTLGLTCFVQWWVAQNLSNPIGELRDVATEFGKGNLAARYQTDRSDEVGELAVTFNEMAGNLETNIKTLSETQEELVRKERLATIGQLTATVSHELRNPLGAVRSASDAIAKMADSNDTKMARAIALLNRGQSRCDRIIDELLNYARSPTLNMSAIELDRWLKEVLSAYQTPEGIAVERNLDCPVRVVLDQHRMEQALCNVLDNACDSMTQEDQSLRGSTEGKLTIETRRTGDRVELIVADEGVGIPPAARERVFEPLFSSKSFGIGLGLPTVKQIMEQHNGGVEISGGPGDGTTVVLWLPLLSEDGDGLGARNESFHS